MMDIQKLDIEKAIKDLNNNPFYTKPNYDLLKTVDVRSHLSCGIPEMKLRIKNADLLNELK